MKAKPVKRVGMRWVECPIKEMTHLKFHMPSVARIQILPVITKGTRDGTPCWSWNGDTEKPTLKPSVNVEGYCGDIDAEFKCHSFITEGNVQFLSDCSHDKAGQTVPLIDL